MEIERRTKSDKTVYKTSTASKQTNFEESNDTKVC